VSCYNQREFQEEEAGGCNDSLTLRSTTGTHRSVTPLSCDESTAACCVLRTDNGALRSDFITAVVGDMEGGKSGR